MHNFYISKSGSIFKVYGSIYEQLDTKEALSFLEKFKDMAIEDLRINGNLLYVILENGKIKIEKGFLNKETEFSKRLRIKIKEAQEERDRRSAKDFKNKFNGYIPPINREKSKRMGALIVAGAIVFTMSATTVLAFFGKDRDRGESNPKSSQEIFTPLPEQSTKPDIDERLSFNDNNYIYAELAFDDMTNNAINNQGESQVEVVTRNCATYVEPYISRYALPHDLTYSICTLERGILDSDLDRSDFFNPMQLKGLSGEYFKVPVYENGVLTGEYDCFYAFSEDDPRIADHPNDKILIIENLEDHFQIACALFRRDIDRYKNIFIAVDAYNKGLYAFSNVFDKPLFDIPQDREYYQENFNDFSWTSFIGDYYKILRENPDYVYGDPTYIWDVLKHLDMGDKSSVIISYYYKGELIEVSLTNTNKLDNTSSIDYNSGPKRG